MWENFKKKVSNFIYEEIEEEIDEEEKAEDEKKQEWVRKSNSRNVKTKMTFEYPDSRSSFRFPVIPDEQERPFVDAQLKGEWSNQTNPIHKPAYIRRGKKSKRRVQQPEPIHPRPLYEQKKLEKELENIPAFKRRNRRSDSTPEQVDQAPSETMADQDHPITYSKPDELDEIFQRKRKREAWKDKDELELTRSEDLKPSNFPSSTNRQANSLNREAPTIEQSDRTIELETASAVDSLDDPVTTYAIPKHEPSHPAQETLMVQASRQEKLEVNDTLAGRNARLEESEAALPYYLLDDQVESTVDHRAWLQEQKSLLEQTLEHFNIDAKIVALTQGPTVTRIEIQPALGVKVSRIRNLADDIKLNLAARDIRIEAPIPGKHTVGIEIPNQEAELVHLQQMLDHDRFQAAESPLTVALGLTIEGEPYYTDIRNMPHGLIAGATGSGKSVCINTIILSLLYKAHYEEVKLMLIDPKMVELTQYNGIPHLLTPVITDAKAATVALKWAVDEMERRYALFVEHQVRNIKRYNRMSPDPLPYIVIIIDELADLMLVSPQEVEDYISRIAQKARAAGIHLILATQRPSVDVITGLIKANIPSRIAFAVSSQVDSRTILDSNGAEKLLGKGDMLFIENGINKQLRLQGPFVSDDEIDRVVQHLRSKAEPNYYFEHEQLFLQIEHDEEDDLFEDVVEFVLEERRASTSLLQRRFRIGYNRAARLIDALYEHGIVSAQNGSKPREVLISKAQWEEIRDHH